MNLQRIVAELKAERDQIDNAISALNGISPQPRRGRPPKTTQVAAMEGLNSNGRRRGRPPGSTNAPRKRGRRQLSPAARKKLSRLLKQRWAQGKMRRRAKAR